MITKQYSADDLWACWNFVRHDFAQLVSLLEWLDTLPHDCRAEQLDAARGIAARSNYAGAQNPQGTEGGEK